MLIKLYLTSILKKITVWFIKTTLVDARKIDTSIPNDDEKAFFNESVEHKKQMKGNDFFIAPYPDYEYQVDLFLLTI